MPEEWRLHLHPSGRRKSHKNTNTHKSNTFQ